MRASVSGLSIDWKLFGVWGLEFGGQTKAPPGFHPGELKLCFLNFAYCRSRRADCVAELAWANIAVLDCTRMLLRARRVDS